MKKNGFTLIELLAVIVILAILALIVSPIISGVITNAKSSAFDRDVEAMEKAAEIYSIKHLDSLQSSPKSVILLDDLVDSKVIKPILMVVLNVMDMLK